MFIGSITFKKVDNVLGDILVISHDLPVHLLTKMMFTCTGLSIVLITADALDGNAIIDELGPFEVIDMGNLL
jgi:hypothetical protein